MDVTFVGVCSVDIYSKINRLPNISETIHGIGYAKGFGGKASNACAQCTFLNELSNRPVLITRVGKDGSGDEIIEYFKKVNISTEFVFQDDSNPTGLAICFVLDKAESAIVIHTCPLSLDLIHQSQQRLLSSRFVVTNFEAGIEVVTETLRIAKTGGAKTILTPAPILQSLDHSLLKFVSIIVLNRIELQALGDVEQLFSEGVEVVIETRGAEGAAIFEPGKAVVTVESPKVSAVDTTGAGDSFLGTFVCCLSRGYSLVESTRIGCFVASISVQSVGTQDSYPRLDHPQIKCLFDHPK